MREKKLEKQQRILPFFSISTWLKIFFVALVFILGLAVQHYYIEPLIASTFSEQFKQCLTNKQLLNSEINSCYVELTTCRNACASKTT